MPKKTAETAGRKSKSAAPKASHALIIEPALAEEPKKSRSKGRESKPEAPAPAETVRRKTKPPATAKPQSPAASKLPATKLPATKRRKATVKIKDETGEPLEVPIEFSAPVEDPIGDTSDGEGRVSTSDNAAPDSFAEMAAYRADTSEDALEGTLENSRESSQSSGAPEEPPAAKPKKRARVSAPQATAELAADDAPGDHSHAEAPAKLDRLQKILSQAGVASRRHAEEMIEAGRVMVNGQVVTQLGTKADRARDHIRVDGKLIAGAERHRYFVLNKPRGYVTTVSDPEGRPTVMQFFSKTSERLYPVGRLDYESEGLLLITNDGELANQLTRAASGIEKTYLVKVAGQPTEEDLDQLRAGVRIERDAPGSDKVNTAPAQIRQVRQGDNPWYEVVLIEGRNRELRKMFQAVGHFVEKIRRVGYGPLVLDLEPGQLRELDSQELSLLRLAAEGKWKPRRPNTVRTPTDERRRPAERSRSGEFDRGGGRNANRSDPDRRGPDWRERKGPERTGAPHFGQREGRPFNQKPPEQRSFGSPARGGKPFRPRDERAGKTDWQPRDQRPAGSRESREGQRGAGPGFGRPQGERFGTRSGARSGPPREFGRQEGARPSGDSGRFGAQRSEQRPFRGRSASGDRPPRFDERRGATSRPQPREQKSGLEESPRKPGARQPGGRPGSQRPNFQRQDRPGGRFDRTPGKNPGRPRGEGFAAGPAQRFDKAPGKGWSKGPEKSWDRGSATRPRQAEGSAPAFRDKPRPAFGARQGSSAKPGFSTRPAPEGRERPASGAAGRGSGSGPRGAGPGRFSKPGGNRSGFKSKPGAFKRGGSRPGGSRAGGGRPGDRKRD
jgi:23S rRNA pseudouridine2605 synthase